MHAQLALVPPDDDAVVAEDHRPSVPFPVPRHGGLARARLADEEMPAAGSIHDSAGVQFDAAPRGQKMGHEQFVQRVAERIERGALAEVRAVIHDLAAGEIPGEARLAHRHGPKRRRSEAEGEPVPVLVKPPVRARIEDLAAGGRVEEFAPRDLHPRVRDRALRLEAGDRAFERDARTAVRRGQLDQEAADGDLPRGGALDRRSVQHSLLRGPAVHDPSTTQPNWPQVEKLLLP